MNPLRLRGEGYGRFDQFAIDIPEGTVAIVGPNGAGKSRLLGALELALFAGRGELQQWIAPNHQRLLIELEFEHGGKHYRVRRVCQTGARARQTVDFEQHVFSGANGPSDAPGGWHTLTRETAAETDKLIVDTIGLSRETFNASAFLAQGNTSAFPDASPAERKRLLGEVLDPTGLWPRLSERARADLRSNELELAMLAAQMAERAEKLEALPDATDDVERFAEEEERCRCDAIDAEDELAELQKREVETAAAAERIRSLTAAKHHARTERDRVARELQAARNSAERLEAAEQQLAKLGEFAAALPDLEAEHEKQNAARLTAAAQTSRREQAERRATELAAEASRLRRKRLQAFERYEKVKNADPDEERCVLCQQVLGREARLATLAGLRATLGDLDGRSARAAEESAGAREEAEAIVVPEAPPAMTFANLVDALSQARAAVASAAALRAQTGQWRDAADKIDGLEVDLLAAEHNFNIASQELVDAATGEDTDALARSISAARAAVGNARTNLELATQDLTRARQRLEQLRAVKQELDGFHGKQKGIQDRIDVLRLADRAFGRDGIPALIAENAIPQIEAKANEILELMPTAKGETLRVELRTQRALKGSEALKETLDIVALDAHGARPYETYSGGEKGRLNVALRLALAQLLAHRRGAESRVLCLDEVEYLDALGQEQLVEVVRHVGDAYDRVLVVSHAAGVRDAFETVIEVASDPDGVSYLVGSEARVEVIA